MPEKHNPRIIEIMGNVVSPDDQKRKYTDRQIMKLLILLQTFTISCRSAREFLTNREEYIAMVGVKEIPGFQLLSRRARVLDLHTINGEIAFLYSMESIAAMDSLMIHTCKHSTAARRNARGNYKYLESGWPRTTRGWSYGGKCHMTPDVDSLLIMEWLCYKG